MTKKHFITLADTIRQHNRLAGHGVVHSQFDTDHIEMLAAFCASQNPRFNRQRWLDYIAGTHGPNGGKR